MARPRSITTMLAAVEVDLRRWRADRELDESRCQLARHLAKTLDDGAGMATAAVARELRAVLDALRGAGAEEPLDVFADLGAPMGHASEPSTGDVRA